MYRKYHTEGFVLEGFNLGEANKLFLIFTKNLGMIRASGRSVRNLESKLRYGLVNYDLSLLTVIKSKKGWKVTGAASLSNAYFSLADSRQKFFLKVFILLKKLIPEEEPNPSLFDILIRSYYFLMNNKLSEEQLQSLEYLTVLRILKNLGYLNYPEDWQSMVDVSTLDLSIINGFTSLRREALSRINQSLKTSQLM
jgi:DNA repair protein RecO (recombination protein O)